jgi:hypothetical protein
MIFRIASDGRRAILFTSSFDIFHIERRLTPRRGRRRHAEFTLYSIKISDGSAYATTDDAAAPPTRALVVDKPLAGCHYAHRARVISGCSISAWAHFISDDGADFRMPRDFGDV